MIRREDLKSEIHLEILNLRALEYLLESEEFKTLYDSAVSKEEIDFYLSTRDTDAIRFWMKAQRITDLSSYNIKQLRSMGQRLKVKDYHILPKNILILEIRKCSKQSDCMS